jgi:hypothetical protein
MFAAHAAAIGIQMLFEGQSQVQDVASDLVAIRVAGATHPATFQRRDRLARCPQTIPMQAA